MGRSASTVRRWERAGLIRPARTVSGQRYFTGADVIGSVAPGVGGPSAAGGGVLPGVVRAGPGDDLASQVAAMEHLCAGLSVVADTVRS
ncbi:MAG: MerR family DNA-binding transcriptional regulator [Mycobacterium sp.]